MREGHINLYSDTHTRPTRAMREAMMNAEVGDEQKGLDKSVNALCERVAEMLGKEAAVFLPSGTMCNEIALMVHCRPGDEVYAHKSCHIVNFEAGGPAALAGVHVHVLDGERGIYSADALRDAIRAGSRYDPRPALVEMEQTANLGGGAVWTLDEMRAVSEVARERGLAVHIDGARLMNASVAAGVAPHLYGDCTDSVWIDLTKGLGCPVGAVLAGSQRFIDDVWRWKQRIGGALRQAGMLAAAGTYALSHHVERLADDHANARRFGEIVTAASPITLPGGPSETNIVIMDVGATGVSAPEIVGRLEARGINMGAFSATTLRAVTHLDVDEAQIEEAAKVLLEVIAE